MFIIKHVSLMWYNKNLNIDEIHKELQKHDFSLTAENIIKHFIVKYVSLHEIKFSDKQKITEKLNIPKKELHLKKLSE